MGLSRFQILNPGTGFSGLKSTKNVLFWYKILNLKNCQKNPKVFMYQFPQHFGTTNDNRKSSVLLNNFTSQKLSKYDQKWPNFWQKLLISWSRISINSKSRDWDLEWIPGSRDWLSGLQALFLIQFMEKGIAIRATVL